MRDQPLTTNRIYQILLEAPDYVFVNNEGDRLYSLEEGKMMMRKGTGLNEKDPKAIANFMLDTVPVEVEPSEARDGK